MNVVQVDPLIIEETSQSLDFSYESSSTESDKCEEESSEEESINIVEYLYMGSNVTVNDLLITVNLIKLKHGLSNNAINHIMELLKTILPQPNKCPRSLRKSQKYFLPSDTGSFSKNFTICSSCENLIEERRLNDFKCSKCLADQSVIPFLSFDVKKQLEIILSNQEYVEQIRNSVSMAKSLTNGLKSTPIGSFYYRNKVKDIESDMIVSLNINSDGAPLTKYKIFQYGQS